ncbi:MAG: hypothetical protein KJ626_05925 [Verrucomicrobia bacterium]|nr:hypothetical protein [Verrucomicrobiota bacterium]
MRSVECGIFGIVMAGLVAALTVPAEEPVGLRVARELHREGDHKSAAIEFRRLALESGGADAGGYYWAAAHEYRLGRQHDIIGKMLDRVEDANPSLSNQAMLLRGENALDTRQFSDAAFYFESLFADKGADREYRDYAGLRLAGLHLRNEDPAKAREVLSAVQDADYKQLGAVSVYQAGRDKSPTVGGFLGLIPGLGYAYSGEYANGLRSLILNGLFIWGMVETANDEQWGAFAAIIFFEITWYTGSIYGGIDSAHRYNRDRLQEAEKAIMGEASFEPDYSVIPSVTLQFSF